jgi:hypothetical protein
MHVVADVVSQYHPTVINGLRELDVAATMTGGSEAWLNGVCVVHPMRKDILKTGRVPNSTIFQALRDSIPGCED